MDLQLDTRRSGDATIVSATGEIDHFSAPQLRSELQAALQAGARRVVVDLTPTEFLDSSGLGALMAVSKQQEGTDSSIVIACPQPHLRKLFAISRLDEVLVVRDSLDEALAG